MSTDNPTSYGPRTGKRTPAGESPATAEYYDDLVDNGGESSDDALMPRKGAPTPRVSGGGKGAPVGSSSDAMRQRAATLDNTSANKSRPRVRKGAMS